MSKPHLTPRHALPLLLILLAACRKPTGNILPIPPNATVTERTFYSPALRAKATYLLIAPKHPRPPLHVLYLLHGNGSSRTEWEQTPFTFELAGQNYVLVLPEGHSSYFLNSATRPHDRYEDFLTQDLIANAESTLPVRPQDRAIAGVSMGGFAALVLALKHPALYRSAAALSPPVDITHRAFTLRRLGQSLALRSIFGPAGSPSRAANDPFALIRTADPAHTPYIFLSTGSDEPLRVPIQRFEAALTAHQIPHEFHIEPGSHNWLQWNAQLAAMLATLSGAENSTHRLRLAASFSCLASETSCLPSPGGPSFSQLHRE